MFPEPRQAPALVYHQVSRVLRLVFQCVHRHVRVVRHLCNYQQGGAAREPTGPGLACPHLQYHPLGLELRLCRRSGTLVVRSHQPYRRRRVGPWAQRFGPRHIRVRFLVLTIAYVKPQVLLSLLHELTVLQLDSCVVLLADGKELTQED